MEIFAKHVARKSHSVRVGVNGSIGPIPDYAGTCPDGRLAGAVVNFNHGCL